MEESILTSTKKILGLGVDYTPFDPDITTHINAAFSTLTQLGVGPAAGFMIDDAEDLWESYEVPDDQKNMVKTYIYLKVRMAFDPPGTSFLVTAMEKQIQEYEWRLNALRESALVGIPEAPPTPELPQLDPPLNLTVTPIIDNLLVEWDSTPNVELYMISWKEVTSGDWIIEGHPEDGLHQSHELASNWGVEYEVYVQTQAMGYSPADSEHFFVTGID